MGFFRSFFLIIFSILLLGHVKSQNVPNNHCIGCICEAASRCNMRAGCMDSMCGMFRFTYPYWLDGGRPVVSGGDPNDPMAWIECSQQLPCAAETVRNYATRYAQDCNGDGVISCVDYAMVHHLGGYGCNTRDLDFFYKRQFDDCLRQLREKHNIHL